ncbi:MAG: carboxypeptidase regulatory-like domain-containing protein, partial [Bryobacteraceae bacterium]
MVTINHLETNQTRTTTTNTAGQYRFPTIVTGRYELKVTADGFRTSTLSNIEVTVNKVTRANIVLELGAVTESVTVSSTSLLLQTDRAEVRHEVSARTLENVPVPLGRNYQMLIPTLPGMSPPENAHSVPSNPSRAVRFGVNGTNDSNNNTRIDGASQTNVWLPHMTAYTPALEAVETVNVVTNSFDAEQGLAGGAAINVQIKSGTNSLHGSGFVYSNNHKLNAYPYFSDRSERKPKFLYNQFGATVGGPLKRDRIFFFVSYEGTRERSNTQRFVDVPNAKMRTGDLSDSPNPVYDPLSGDYDPALGYGQGRNRTPFPNNFIPRSRWANASKVIIDSNGWPLPNMPGEGTLGLTNNYLGSGKYLFDRDTLDSKVNFLLSEKWTSFVRFSVLDYRMDNPTVFGDFGGRYLHATNSNPGHGFGNTLSGTLSSTYVATPSLVFDAYFGYTLMDTNVEQPNLDQNIGRDFLGIPGTNGTRRFEGGWPRLQIDGFQQLGIDNNFMPYFRRDPQKQIVANGNYARGKHELRFGTDLYWQHLNHEQPEFSGSQGPASGGFFFRNATTTLNGGPGGNDYNSIGSFLLGFSRESGRLIQFPQEYTTRTKLFSAYIRDRWQGTRRLT